MSDIIKQLTDAAGNNVFPVAGTASTYDADGNSVDILLDEKVDKVTGKGLSKNDYTDAEKAKLNALPTAASLAESLNAKINEPEDEGTSGQVLTTDGEGNRYWGTSGSSVISTTWSALKALRDAGTLKPSQIYRITDYQCTVSSSIDYATAASNLFDILVMAIDASHLSEDAKAAHHSGDSYFASSDLDAWELKYCIDNDTDRFDWADSTNGKGVIYYMKDEFNNEVPYDFKNVKFWRAYDSDKYIWSTISTSSAGVAAYTFSSNGSSSTTAFTDFSLNGFNKNVYSNIIRESVSSKKQVLNGNCTFGDECYQNSFCKRCRNNTLASNCYNNTFGDGCSLNTFNTCDHNSFGQGCYNNSFEYNCSRNIFGNYCRFNYFTEYCSQNTFGCYCTNNTLGSRCHGNTFGNNCQNNTFASDSTGTAGDYFYYNTIENGASYNIIYNTGTASSSALVKNYQIKSSVVGTSSSKNIIAVTRNNDYDTIVEKNTSGTIVQYVGSSKEDNSNKVTSLSASSTDTQYPSAKCVYDLVGDIESTINAIRGV